jgi:hypothetical protein
MNEEKYSFNFSLRTKMSVSLSLSLSPAAVANKAPPALIALPSPRISSPTRVNNSEDDEDDDDDDDSEESNYIKRLSAVSLRQRQAADPPSQSSTTSSYFDEQQERKYMDNDEEENEREEGKNEGTTQSSSDDEEEEEETYLELDLCEGGNAETIEKTVYTRLYNAFLQYMQQYQEQNAKRYDPEQMDALFKQWESLWMKPQSETLMNYVKSIAKEEGITLSVQMVAFSKMHQSIRVLLDVCSLWNETEKHLHYQRRFNRIDERIRDVNVMVRATEAINQPPSSSQQLGVVNVNQEHPTPPPLLGLGLEFGGMGGVGGEGAFPLFADPNTNRLPHNQGTIATPIEIGKATSHALLLKHLQDMCGKLGYKKRGGAVYAEIIHKGYYTKAYRQVSTIIEWLYEITRYEISPEMNFHRQRVFGSAKKAADEFAKDRETNGKPFNPCRHIWSFGNGRYNGDTEEFIPYNKMEPVTWRDLDSVKFFPDDLNCTGPLGPDYQYNTETHAYSDHKGVVMYIKNPSNPIYYHPDGVTVMYDETTKQGRRPLDSYMKISIPPIDVIFKTQKFSYEQKKWIFGLAGRQTRYLGVENGGDNWQIWFYMYGIARTGKSTLITAITDMYNRADIVHLESNGETTFALPDPKDKYMWIIREVKGNWNLSVDRFQLMVSGEEVIVPRKGIQDPIVEIWNIPGCGGGNDLLGLPDKKGSIIRRIAMVEFGVPVTKVDSNLGLKLKKYMPDFIRKCSCAYNNLKRIVGDGDIWSFVPREMINNRETMKKSVDLIHGFVVKNCTTMPSWDTYKTKPYFVTPLKDFQKYLTKSHIFASSTKYKKDAFTEEDVESALTSHGYRVITLDSRPKLFSEIRRDDPAELEREEEEKKEREEDLGTIIKSVTYQDRVYSSGSKIICGIRIKGEERKLLNNDEFYQTKITYLDIDPTTGRHRVLVEPDPEDDDANENENENDNEEERKMQQ